MEARVTGRSQTYRLKERMEQAQVRHGEEIRADLPGIRVIATGGTWLSSRRNADGEVYFCTMGPVWVRKVAISGDGRPLPGDVALDNLEVGQRGDLRSPQRAGPVERGPAAHRGRRDAGRAGARG